MASIVQANQNLVRKMRKLIFSSSSSLFRNGSNSVRRVPSELMEDYDRDGEIPSVKEDILFDLRRNSVIFHNEIQIRPEMIRPHLFRHPINHHTNNLIRPVRVCLPVSQ